MPNGTTASRNVGMVMVPGEHITKVEVQEDTQIVNGTEALRPNRQLSRSAANAGWPEDESLYI
jgi:hypothetical protein